MQQNKLDKLEKEIRKRLEPSLEIYDRLSSKRIGSAKDLLNSEISALKWVLTKIEELK